MDDFSGYVERIQSAKNGQEVALIALDWWTKGFVNPHTAKEIFLAIVLKGLWLEFQSANVGNSGKFEDMHNYLMEFGFSLFRYDSERYDLPYDYYRYSDEKESDEAEVLVTQPSYNLRQVQAMSELRVGGVYTRYAHYEKYQIVALGTGSQSLLFMQYAGGKGRLEAHTLHSFGLVPMGEGYIPRHYLVDTGETLTPQQIRSVLIGSAAPEVENLFGEADCILPYYKVTVPQQPVHPDNDQLTAVEQLKRGAVIRLWQSVAGRRYVYLQTDADGLVTVLESIHTTHSVCRQKQLTSWEMGLLPYPRNNEFHQHNWVEQTDLTLTEEQIQQLISRQETEQLYEEVFTPWIAERKRKRASQNS